MDREDILKFTNSVILVSKLFSAIEDRFLKQKLHNKISDFVSAFVEQKGVYSPMSHNVKDLISSIDNLIDYSEHLAYTSKTNTAPLLVAQRNLLKLKLHILRENKIKAQPRIPKKFSAPDVSVSVETPTTTVRQNLRPKTTRFALKSNSNKERIFNFIKRKPDIRTKDVLSEFSALSGRTVKRSLKELTDNGLLKKRLEGSAVFYLPSDLN